MFKFAPVFLKKNKAHFINKIICFICVFIHVFCFWEGIWCERKVYMTYFIWDLHDFYKNANFKWEKDELGTKCKEILWNK